jgi:hypothetical protein
LVAELAVDLVECWSEWFDLATDERAFVGGGDGMPVDAINGHGDLWHKGFSAELYTAGGGSLFGYWTDYLLFARDAQTVEEGM